MLNNFCISEFKIIAILSKICLQHISFLDSKIAVTIRTILNFYRDIQLILVFIICFIIANMFQEIAETLKDSLNKIISIQKSDQVHIINKNGSNTTHCDVITRRC